jgi:hypothetical protein
MRSRSTANQHSDRRRRRGDRHDLFLVGDRERDLQGHEEIAKAAFIVKRSERCATLRSEVGAASGALRSELGAFQPLKIEPDRRARRNGSSPFLPQGAVGYSPRPQLHAWRTSIGGGFDAHCRVNDRSELTQCRASKLSIIPGTQQNPLRDPQRGLVYTTEVSAAPAVSSACALAPAPRTGRSRRSGGPCR